VAVLQLVVFWVALQAAGMSGPIGREAIWTPGLDLVGAVRAACEARETTPDCFLEEAGRAGAPPAALAFSRQLFAASGGQVGLLRHLGEEGRVSVARVEYPLRANEHQGVWLVNGAPAFVDVDDLVLLPRERLASDRIYAALARRYGNLSLWPGDRSSEAGLHATKIAGGGQRFTVAYVLRAGCRACDLVGTARFAFDFDANGTLTRVSLVSVSDRVASSSKDGGVRSPGASDPRRTLRVTLGERFTVALDTGRTGGQGYRWQFARPLDENVIAFVSRHDEPSPDGSGSSIREVWTFRAAGRGSAQIDLEYSDRERVRSTPLRTIVYTVQVR
jgi:predicted secreted protein